MIWTVTSGDILEEPADVLICSANVFLNLSGGVGGAMLLRYGPSMQEFLHSWLAREGRHAVSAGEVVISPPFGAPYTFVLHAVAIDAFYQTSIEMVARTVCRALQLAAEQGARRVALAALATGYGRMSISSFSEAVCPLSRQEWPPISEVVICLRHENEAAELRRALAEAQAR